MAGLRSRAVSKMLGLTKGLFATCHWCRREIVWYQRIPVGAIKSVVKSGNPGKTVVFRHNGELKRMFIVTIDHVQEISKGGRNYASNLVLSCWPCNGERSAQPKQDTYRECVQCGRLRKGSKKKPAGRRRCGDCCKANRTRILAEKAHYSATLKEQEAR
jgi:hypothetical protein